MTANNAGDKQPASITLRAGSAVCEIHPGIGGSISRWAIGDQNMMRRAAPKAIAAGTPLGMSSFPLVPYSNRIGHGRFEWAGAQHQLASNLPSEPHAIHGTGWMRPWAVDRVAANSLILRFAQLADEDWPWPFEAEQHILLEEDALTLNLFARNLSDQAAPLAFGHHPYFDSAGASLQFRAADVWQTGKDGLPSCAMPPHGDFDFSEASPVSGKLIDNGYAGWDGKAQIRWAGRPLMLDIEANMAAAVVYITDGGDAFCFEPVPHITNALNLPGQEPQMPVIAPQKTFMSRIVFAART